MIAVFTAVVPEAKALLEQLKRKGISVKRADAGNLPLWECDDGGILLAVTGTGEIASAVAAARVLTRYPADFAVNFGTAAGTDPVSSVFVIDKITEETTGKDFYPGIVWRTPFEERALKTVAAPAAAADSGALTDMEGAGFFQAANRFLTSDRIILLKVVSDAGVSGRVTAESLRQACAGASEAVTEYILWLEKAADAVRQETKPENPDAWAQAEDDLHGSEAMRQRLRRILRWQELSGQDPGGLLKRLYENGDLPAENKRKGKEVLERIEREIL
ncbi:MAG: hypothetical protein ACOX78_07080 [Lachnospiraceae bacterium]|jgi:nucleoside phosphorylase